MDKKKFRIIMAVVFIAMTGVLLLFSRIYISSKTVHPDGIVTMVNPTTDQRVQAYAIGKMQVYIDMAYRMDLPVWNMYLRTLAQQYDHSVPELTGEQDTNLALNRENPDADINPFILRLTIRNISDTPTSRQKASTSARSTMTSSRQTSHGRRFSMKSGSSPVAATRRSWKRATRRRSGSSMGLRRRRTSTRWTSRNTSA